MIRDVLIKNDGVADIRKNDEFLIAIVGSHGSLIRLLEIEGIRAETKDYIKSCRILCRDIIRDIKNKRTFDLKRFIKNVEYLDKELNAEFENNFKINSNRNAVLSCKDKLSEFVGVLHSVE